jgi:serine/threonine-protein kinase
MELLPGETLDQLVRKGGPLKPFDAASVIRQAAVGLYTAHCQGIIHRDVKPGNIMLAPNGRAVVTDFGVCKIMEVHNVTTAGQVVGTARYLSPEQFMGATLDARSDVFALGALFFYLLTGEHLRIAKDLVVLSRVVTRGEDQKRAREMPGIPNAFRAVLVKAVALEPHDRFQNALELAHALEEACLTREIQALQAPPPRAPPRTPPPLPVHRAPVDLDATLEDAGEGQTEVSSPGRSVDPVAPHEAAEDAPADPSHTGERQRSAWAMVTVMVVAAAATAWLLAMWLE